MRFQSNHFRTTVLISNRRVQAQGYPSSVGAHDQAPQSAYLLSNLLQGMGGDSGTAMLLAENGSRLDDAETLPMKGAPR